MMKLLLVQLMLSSIASIAALPMQQGQTSGDKDTNHNSLPKQDSWTSDYLVSPSNVPGLTPNSYLAEKDQRRVNFPLYKLHKEHVKTLLPFAERWTQARLHFYNHEQDMKNERENPATDHSLFDKKDKDGIGKEVVAKVFNGDVKKASQVADLMQKAAQIHANKLLHVHRLNHDKMIADKSNDEKRLHSTHKYENYLMRAHQIAALDPTTYQWDANLRLQQERESANRYHVYTSKMMSDRKPTKEPFPKIH